MALLYLSSAGEQLLAIQFTEHVSVANVAPDNLDRAMPGLDPPGDVVTVGKSKTYSARAAFYLSGLIDGLVV